MEKLLPQNVEAEAAVLGSILIDPEAIMQVADYLKPDDFYRDAHRVIYQAAMELYQDREPADLITLTDELGRRGKLDEVGGASYVTSLANQVPTSANVDYYGHIVERTAVLRRLIHAAGQIAAIAYNEPDAGIALDQAEKLIFNIGQRFTRSDFERVSDTLREYIDKLEQLQEHRGTVVGVPTGFSDLDKMTGGLQKSDLIILAARPAVGKCLTAGTLIDDPATGARLTIEECYRCHLSAVYGVAGDGRVRPTAVADWIDSGVQPCYRVRTRTGRVVEVTGHHPFLTADGWVPLHDLVEGSAIAVPSAVPAFGQDESWPLELVRLLAYFIAEGGLTTKSPKFTNTDPVIVEDFKQIIARHFPTCAIRQERITYVVAQPRTAEAMRGGAILPPNPLTHWLKDLGLMGKLSKEKFFPDCVWTWSRRYLAEFIRILMSCDGSIYQVGGHPRIEFTVAAPRLAADLHHAFIRFGLVAKYFQTTAGAYRIEITDPASVLHFQTEIGWFGEKTTRFVEFTERARQHPGNVGYLPRAAWTLVRVAAQQRGLSLSELARRSGETVKTGKRAGYNAHARRGLPRYRLERSAEVLGDARLRQLSHPDLYWDVIASIEPIGEQQVYDLCVPDGANFIAQDICVHNTAMALSLAHNAALRHGQSVAIFSLEMSKEQLVARLLSMDAAIDQSRLRTGFLDDSEWERISISVGELSKADIYVDDTPGITLVEMRSKARRLMMDHGFSLLIVDYLQLMQGSGMGRGHENRVQEVSEISRGLKGLARELNVPVMALAQLSRAVESRTEKKPQLSDLRESGCLAGETLIYLPDEGVHRRIDELIGTSGFNVLALNTDTWKLERCPVTHAFSTGRKPVFRLTTRLGRSLRATANHQFLTIAGWRRLDELAPGIRIALPRTLPGPEAATMRDEELALLGHLIGDGCTLPKHAMQYTTKDYDLAEIVARLASAVFGDAIRPRIEAEQTWYQVYLPPTTHLTHRVHGPIVTWLSDLGVFGLRSYEKRVPERVFQQPPAQIAVFLRHLWATDGCINLSQGKKHYANIYYASSSERLARDVQMLLLRLGINATCSRHEQPGKGRDQFHISISGRTDALRFLSMVGGIGQSRATQQTRILEYLGERVENTNRDVVPREIWQMHALPALRLGGLTHRQMQIALGNAYCGSALYKQNLSRDRAGRLAQIVSSPALHLLAQSDVYWDEVISVEPDGEADVYDITVEGLHNFIGEATVLHNSIEQDADIVMFIYREEVYNPETERKNIADIIVAKHRNGPVGQVSLYFQASQTRYRDLDLQRTPDYTPDY